MHIALGSLGIAMRFLVIAMRFTRHRHAISKQRYVISTAFFRILIPQDTQQTTNSQSFMHHKDVISRYHHVTTHTVMGQSCPKDAFLGLTTASCCLQI